MCRLLIVALFIYLGKAGHALQHHYPASNLAVCSQNVASVQCYKYLPFDSKLNFKANTEAVCRKGLLCLRRLFCFHVDETMMFLFHRAFNESVLSFSLVL